MTKVIKDKGLDKISAGLAASDSLFTCPKCKSKDVTMGFVPIGNAMNVTIFTCNSCGHTWNLKLDSSHSDNLQ